MRTTFSLVITALALASQAACSPKYNWRDYQSPDATYRVMFPAKPAQHTRTVNLNGTRLPMTMTAAEVDGVVYAVATAQAGDVAKAESALDAMQAALVANIDGTVSSASKATSASSSGGQAHAAITHKLTAEGLRQGVRMQLVGHFEARDTQLYQVIVMGPSKAITPEQTEQFMSSFRPR